MHANTHERKNAIYYQKLYFFKKKNVQSFLVPKYIWYLLLMNSYQFMTIFTFLLSSIVQKINLCWKNKMRNFFSIQLHNVLTSIYTLIRVIPALFVALKFIYFPLKWVRLAAIITSVHLSGTLTQTVTGFLAFHGLHTTFLETF